MMQENEGQYMWRLDELPKDSLKTEERILEYNNQGFPIGLTTRIVAHGTGRPHGSIHLAAITDKIKIGGVMKRLIVLQKRAAHKINPFLDYTYAGHMTVHEPEFEKPVEILGSQKHLAESVVREGQEELGLPLDIGNVTYTGTGTFLDCLAPELNKGQLYINKEYTHMFIYRIPWKQVEQIFNNVTDKKTDNEVESVHLMDLEEYFKKTSEDREKMLTAWGKGEKYTNMFVPRHQNIDLIRSALQKE